MRDDVEERYAVGRLNDIISIAKETTISSATTREAQIGTDKQEK
jgi:hypothetical protein